MGEMYNQKKALVKEKGQIRTHRVGTMTCGLVFIFYGVLFLAHIVLPKLDYMVLLDLWPVVLICLGVEVLASCTRKNQENEQIVYDFPAVLLMVLLMLFVMIMAAMQVYLHSEWGFY